MAKIRWTEESEFWLKDIHDYISQDNPKAADEVVEGIYQKAQILEDHPLIGYQYESPYEEEIRILLYGHYRIAYTVVENQIDILGVFHGALDIDGYL
jgi:addiction module RelE/StbE family toxin